MMTSSRCRQKIERVCADLLALGENRIACGKVSHEALARCNSFDEGVCDYECFTDSGDESDEVYHKRFKMDEKE
jgi:hypothetical protein